MRKTFTLALAAAFLILLSCSDDPDCPDTMSRGIEYAPDDDSSESIAIEIFYEFLDSLEETEGSLDQPSIMQSSSKFSQSRPRIKSVKSTSALAYGEKSKSSTRSDQTEMQVVEISFMNDDNTAGFSLVTGYPELTDVVAYAPQGTISDTVYNKGLAIFFRDLAEVGEYVTRINEAVSTRSSWEQEYWDGLYKVFSDTKILVESITVDEFHRRGYNKFGYYSALLSLNEYSKIAGLRWGQAYPYNRKVPFYTSSGDHVNVGCFPTAFGQVMAYHKKPTRYNWRTITEYSTPRTSTARIRVPELLWDISVASRTTYNAGKNLGETWTSNYHLAFTAMGYTFSRAYFGSNDGVSATFEDNMKNLGPVLMASTDPYIDAGHVWMIDGLRIYKKYFYSFGFLETSEGVTVRKYRSNAELRMMHCNWGWDGMSDGWYWNFNPQHTKYGELRFTTKRELFYNLSYN